MSVSGPVKTPCVGICSSGIGDSVCRGCKRFAHEVIDWNGYSEEQKHLVMQRIEAFLSQVVGNYLEVVDRRRLLEQLQQRQVKFRPEQPPSCWVFDLLRADVSGIDDWRRLGLRRLPLAADLSPPEIRDAIDGDFYALSCAHHERYIQPGLDQTV